MATRSDPITTLSAALLALALIGCNGGSEESASAGESESAGDDALTWWRDVEPVVRTRCATCHRSGDIAPFALETHEQFVAVASALGPAIEGERMPPWPPDPACHTYAHSLALEADEEATLLTYLAGEMPEGDPADAPPPGDPPDELDPDVTLSMPEPYTPSPSEGVDDYRCFVLPWPAEIADERFVTALQVFPGERAIVHHVILFAVEPGQEAAYFDLDAAEPGPGYTCFGGPGGPPGARWLGGWVPGAPPVLAPEGLGQRVDAGSHLIMQVHYNTAGGAGLADQSSIGFEVATQVDHEATVIPMVDIAWLGGGAMVIPAGDPAVTHEATWERDNPIFTQALSRIGVAPTDEVAIWNAGLHMHTFGTRGRIAIRGPGDAEECLLDIPEWDFNWQSSYSFEAPSIVGADEALHLQCWWDNSAENQPIVDGQIGEPRDVEWGEGSFDEMCLGVLYVSPAQ
ncbi:MAG: monooxygenase [Myxococcales bacterium]|nr:monooxygenase [Myxococcales bacterium]